MGTNLGLILESKDDSEEDSEEDKEIDWGMAFSLLKNRGFSHQEILNLSYPQFNAYMKNINNPLTYGVVIPYMGSGENEKTEEITSKEEIMDLVASMNRDFS